MKKSENKKQMVNYSRRKLIKISPESCWLEDDPFLSNGGPFSGDMLICGTDHGTKRSSNLKRS